MNITHQNNNISNGHELMSPQLNGGPELQPAQHVSAIFKTPQQTGYTLGSKIWYSGTKPRDLDKAKEWCHVVSVPIGKPFIPMPNNLHNILNFLNNQFGPGFWFHIVSDRNDNTIVRITIRLNRKVTETQLAYDAFIARAQYENQ